MVIKKIEYEVEIVLLFPQDSPNSHLPRNFEKEISRHFKQKTHFYPLITERNISITDIDITVRLSKKNMFIVQEKFMFHCCRCSKLHCYSNQLCLVLTILMMCG